MWKHNLERNRKSKNKNKIYKQKFQHTIIDKRQKITFLDLNELNNLNHAEEKFVKKKDIKFI